MGQVEGHPRVLSGLTFLDKEDNPRAQGTQLCPDGSGKSPVWETPQILLAVNSSAVTCTVKKFFPMFRWNFLCIQFLPTASFLLLGTTEQDPSSCHFLFRYFPTLAHICIYTFICFFFIARS